MITAVQDRLEELTPDRVRAYLSLPATDPLAGDDPLWTMIAVAKEQADLYCNNPFEDSTGAPTPIPPSVLAGCLRLVADLHLRRAPGMLADTVGAVSIQYDPSQLTEDVYRHWRPFRLVPGF